MTLTVQTRCDISDLHLALLICRLRAFQKNHVIIIGKIVVRWLGYNLNFETASYFSFLLKMRTF